MAQNHSSREIGISDTRTTLSLRMTYQRVASTDANSRTYEHSELAR
jgi:hypothetical protein